VCIWEWFIEGCFWGSDEYIGNFDWISLGSLFLELVGYHWFSIFGGGFKLFKYAYWFEEEEIVGCKLIYINN